MKLFALLCVSSLATSAAFLPMHQPANVGRTRKFLRKFFRGVELSASSDWFEQKPGESDIKFIKRITNEAPKTEAKPSNQTETKPTGGYQRVEDWEKEKRVKGEMTWEERVQFDGQRLGDRVRQNDILMRNLHTF